MNDIKGPLGRYHGGKFRIANKILPFFPAHEIYIEPFCGMASLLAKKPRAKTEIINDLNERLINVFRVLRDPLSAKKLAQALYLTPYSNAEFLTAKEVSEDPIEDARRLLIRADMGHAAVGASGNRNTGFRHGYRENGQDACMQWRAKPGTLSAWVDRLRGVTIECVPALDLIRRYSKKREALFYVDPPYLAETRKDGLRNYRHELTDQDHVELADTLKKVKGYVVLSGYPSELYDRLYQGWTVHRFGTTDHSSNPRTEAIWLNPRATAAQEQITIFQGA